MLIQAWLLGREIEIFQYKMLIPPSRGGSTIKSEPRALEPVPRAPLQSYNKPALVSVLANLRNPRAL